MKVYLGNELFMVDGVRVEASPPEPIVEAPLSSPPSQFPWRSLLLATNTALSLLVPATTALAAPAAGLSGGANIIMLIQKASFWVGMGVTMWGVVEAQLDYPGWRGRVIKGILGYIAILVIPLVFLELRNSLQVDVWHQLP